MMIANFINQNPAPCTDVFRREGQIIFWSAGLTNPEIHANQNFPGINTARKNSPFFQCLDSLSAGIASVEAAIKEQTNDR